MKIIKILSVILVLCFFCSCKENPKENFSSSPPPVIEKEEEKVEEKVETPEPESEPESTPVPPPTPAPTPQPEPTPTPKPVYTPVTYIERTFDANNSKGLSEEKIGFSYGVAKDGAPHHISVSNQARFDSYTDVEALALDTVSQDKRMYLTFDCGYEYNNLTSSILDTLKEKNVKAAFFCTLDYLEDNPSLVRRMIDEGHIVGNHSATHPVFAEITRTQMAKEILDTEKYMIENFNYSSPYFRYPGGYYNENSLELVTSIGYKSIFWSVAHRDWETNNQPTVQNAIATVTARYHPGAVILLHAVSSANTNGLAEMIDIAHSSGYTFKTLDDYYN